MRGWTVAPGARAGRGERFPRACGDGPVREGDAFEITLFSPRMRGWTASYIVTDIDEDVFPAHAGMDRPLQAA